MSRWQIFQLSQPQPGSERSPCEVDLGELTLKNLHQSGQIGILYPTSLESEERELSRTRGSWAPRGVRIVMKLTEKLTDGELVEAAKEFVSPKRSGQVGKAFALAAGGNMADSVDEFDDAEQDHHVDALAYRDYAMVMFVYGRISRAYFCSLIALKLEPQIPLHPVLRDVLRDFVKSFDRNGDPRQESFEAFDRLRVQYIRSKAM
jgi:hypothetical protein